MAKRGIGRRCEQAICPGEFVLTRENKGSEKHELRMTVLLERQTDVPLRFGQLVLAD